MTIHIKAILVFVIATLFTTTSIAQIKTKIFPENIPSKYAINVKTKKIIEFNPPTNFNNKKTEYKDGIQTENETKNKFALTKNINLDFLKEAKKVIENGKQIYSLTIVAENALNISLEFSLFELSDGDILSIYTNKELTDSITSNQNNLNKVWATRVYQGSELNILLKTDILKSNTRLIINKINFGYKSFGGDFGNIGASANCHINANCPAGNGWDPEKNSIALIVSGGIVSYTGALVMNTCGTNIPYLLTANHCIDGNVSNWVFQFQTLSSDCDTNTGWREDIQFNGCILKANNANTDFALLQLNQTPASNSGIHYSGWSNQLNFFSSTTVLHHPAGDLMKISRDDNFSNGSVYLGAQCLRLDLDLGRLEGGSSGAPYYNQNHRIVAQHYGRPEGGTRPICDITVTMGGRFDLSWTGGGTNSTRLSNWLDPGNTGATGTNTTNVASLSAPLANSFIFITGADNFCTGNSSYTLNTIPGNTSISWTSSNTNVATITPTGNTATLTMVNEGTVTITATITQCGTTIVRTKNITMGFPYFTNLIDGPGIASPNGHYTYTMNLPFSYPLANYNWRVPSGWNLLFGQGTNSIYVQVGGVGNGGFVELDVTACNITRLTNIYTEIGSGGWVPDKPALLDDKRKYKIKAMPNPAQDYVTIVLEATDNKTKDNSYSIQQLKIIDKMGNVKKLINFKAGQLQQRINVADLPKDIYSVSVYDGRIWQSIKIIVQ